MKRRTWKRTLLMVLLLLTGGAIINVAVAWGCALSYTSPPGVGQSFFNTRSEDVAVVIAADRGREVLSLDWRGGTHRDRGLIMKYPGTPWWTKEYISMQGHGVAVGYPYLSLSAWTAERVTWSPADEMINHVTPHWGIATRSDATSLHGRSIDGILPLRPIWPGFAINTIFYAAILWLLFSAPGFVRRRIRARRGQCPACAYPIGASDVCTECGKVVRIVKT